MITEYFDEYTKNITKTLAEIDPEALELAYQVIKNTILNHGRIFVMGNGGSAAIASHLATDFFKGVRTNTEIVSPQVISLNDNMALVTAIANDIGYDDTFRYQLFGHKATVKDMVIVISSSGNSPNIVNALEWANRWQIPTIAIVGFSGGRAKEIADLAIHIPVDAYNLSEDCSQIIMHCLAATLRKQFLMDGLACIHPF